MTAQDKIQQLAMAALRAAPPVAGVPKPATFMAAPEKLRTAIPAAAAPPASPLPVASPAAVSIAPLPVELPEPAEEVAAPKDHSEAELRSMIEARDEQMKKSLASRSLTVTLAIAAVLVGVGTWIGVSPTARAKLASVTPLFQESVRDAKSLANMQGSFNEKLQDIGGHQTQIDQATRSMGVDPASVTPEQEAELDAEMAAMMGENARTSGERDRDVRQKLGFVRALAEAAKGQQKAE